MKKARIAEKKILNFTLDGTLGVSGAFSQHFQLHSSTKKTSHVRVHLRKQYFTGTAHAKNFPGVFDMTGLVRSEHKKGCRRPTISYEISCEVWTDGITLRSTILG